MRHSILIIIFAALFVSCSTIKYVPVKQTDTLTVKEYLRDTVVFTRLETEVKEIYTRDTISALNTKYARSTAEVSNGVLHHTLENTKDSIQIKIKYVDREVVKIEYQEVPVEVVKEVKVVPSWCWILLLLNVLAVTLILIKISVIK